MLFWFEAIGATLLGLGAGWVFVTWALYAPRHGDVLVLLFGTLLLLSAAAFAVGARALRSEKPAAWFIQLFPALVIGWVLWDVLSHL